MGFAFARSGLRWHAGVLRALALFLAAFPLTVNAQDWSCVVDDCPGTIYCSNRYGPTACSCRPSDGSEPYLVDYEVTKTNHPNCGVDQATVQLNGSAVFTSTGTSAATSSGTSTSTSTSTGTSAAVESVTRALAAGNAPVVRDISQIGESSDGKQLTSPLSVREAATLGANQAATVGALFCARGANANAENPADAAAFYASCRQNFGAAKLLNPGGGYKADDATMGLAVAEETLQDFEKKFGVSPDDYMSRMLGAGGDVNGLRSMVEGKLSAAKFDAALAAAEGQGGGSSVTEPNRFAVDLAKGPLKAGASRESLRKSLQEKLAATAGTRGIAGVGAAKDGGGRAGERFEGITPLEEGLFAGTGAEAELSIFEVVHRKYRELTKMMRPGKSLSP